MRVNTSRRMEAAWLAVEDAFERKLAKHIEESFSKYKSVDAEKSALKLVNPSSANLCCRLNELHQHEDLFTYDEASSRISEHVSNSCEALTAKETSNTQVYFHDSAFVRGLNDIAENTHKMAKLTDPDDSGSVESDSDDSPFYDVCLDASEHHKYLALLALSEDRANTVKDLAREACHACGFQYLGFIFEAYDSGFPGVAELRYLGMARLDQSWMVPMPLLALFPLEFLVDRTDGSALNPLEV